MFATIYWILTRNKYSIFATKTRDNHYEPTITLVMVLSVILFKPVFHSNRMVPKRSVFLYFLSGSVGLMTSTQLKENSTVRYDTVQVGKWIKWKWENFQVGKWIKANHCGPCNCNHHHQVG